MQHATTNAERKAQREERARQAERSNQKAPAAKAPATATAPAAKAKKEEEGPKVWVMGRFTPAGVEILAMGDHNTIEKASAAVNKEAGMRVAFVVDARSVPVEALAGIDMNEEDPEEDEEGVA